MLFGFYLFKGQFLFLGMGEVEDFIYQYEGDQRKIMFFFHYLFVNDLGLESKIRYKIPFYYGRTWICYLNPDKSGAVELSFIRGNELSNAQGLLLSKDRKQVRSLSFDSMKNIKEDAVMEVIHEALLLDETTPYASKNKKKRR